MWLSCVYHVYYHAFIMFIIMRLSCYYHAVIMWFPIFIMWLSHVYHAIIMLNVFVKLFKNNISWWIVLFTQCYRFNCILCVFSYTFNKVQDNSEKVWRFYRHDLIKEYFVKPTLAPPLIILRSDFSILYHLSSQFVQ